MQAPGSTTQAFFEVCPFITSDHRQAYAIQRTDYYVSDGHTFASEAIEVYDTQEAAEAALGHHKVAAMRER